MSSILAVPRTLGEPLVHVQPYVGKQRKDNSYDALVTYVEQSVRREEDAYQAPPLKIKREVKLPTKHPRVGGPKPKKT